jgi:hypothetical protein
MIFLSFQIARLKCASRRRCARIVGIGLAELRQVAQMNGAAHYCKYGVAELHGG